MTQLLCRNKIKSYPKWRRVFDADAPAHRAAGLILLNVWRDKPDAKTVWFLFDVTNPRKARAFINAPGAGEQAKRAGVLEGEFHFLSGERSY